MIEPLHRRSLYAATAMYVLMSPLATYNTLAMFGIVESRLPGLQLALTAVMIALAYVASKPLSSHLRVNPEVDNPRAWIAGFWLIGPPVLFAYYHLRFRRQTEIV